MEKFITIIKFITYIFRSKGIHTIHSPFVYQLMDNVFKDKKKYPEYNIIELARQNFLQNVSLIEVEDFGTGGIKEKKYTIKICNICKNSSKNKKYGRLLFRIARYYNPETIVEFGTSLGLSTMYLSMGNKNGKVITIEGAKEIHSEALNLFTKNNILNVNAINTDFDKIISQDKFRFKNIDLVFLDGNHQKEATIRYFEYFMKLSNNNTVIILDDIHWSEGMEEAWNYIKILPSVTLTIDIFAMGLVFFRKELSKQDLVLRYV